MSDTKDALLRTLAAAVESDPQNLPLRLHYVELLIEVERQGEAIDALRIAAEQLPDDEALQGQLLGLLRRKGDLAEALIRAEALLDRRETPAVRLELARILLARGDRDGALEAYRVAIEQDPSLNDPELAALGPVAVAATTTPESQAPEQWAEQFDWGDMHITFKDVVGLDTVKDQINLRILAPFKNPEIYRAFNRSGGGGILLYGPPGCGKTFIARATAGEVGARFLSVGINDILDKYWGESEQLIHALFEEARNNAPSVLFFDEFDALGAARGRSESQFWKTLVDQMLQEMDGMSGRNEDLLIFAATNTPWHVDSAFRRPGRFDRIFFVPPPDEAARAEIITRHVSPLPGGDQIDCRALAAKTPLWTGADLKSLGERASEQALSRSLRTGSVHPVTPEDFDRTLDEMKSTALEWLATARNYARYSNEGGQYDDLTAYLKAAKRWL